MGAYTSHMRLGQFCLPVGDIPEAMDGTLIDIDGLLELPQFGGTVFL